MVAVHGGPGLDGAGLRHVLAPLAEQAELVVPDRRGHGRSDLAGPASWTLDDWADDLAGVIDALQLLGSLGGAGVCAQPMGVGEVGGAEHSSGLDGSARPVVDVGRHVQAETGMAMLVVRPRRRSGAGDPALVTEVVTETPDKHGFRR